MKVALFAAVLAVIAGCPSSAFPELAPIPVELLEIEYGSPEEIESMSEYASACERMARDINRNRIGAAGRARCLKI